MNAVKKALAEKGLADSTIDHHLAMLRTLNNGKDPKSLAFLHKTEDIAKTIAEHYAPSTQKTAYSTIVSVLTSVKDKPVYRKTYQTYYDEMMRLASEESGKKTEEKSEKQTENWLGWKEVQDKREELCKNAPDGLHCLLLSLYTEIQPRRNQDYLLMKVVKKTPTETDANYLVLEKGKPKRFIFNKYKTAKKYGTQTVEIPPSLATTLTAYLKSHPLAKTDAYPLLVADGKPLTAVNSITRALNRIFGKKVGSSMLRHIYLSSKYDIAEMKKDAEGMGHSLNQQREYLKSEASQSVTIPTAPQ